MDSVVYRERHWLSPWISFLVAVLIAALTFVAVAQGVYGIAFGNGRAPIWVLLGFDTVFFLVLVNFLTLTIEVTQETVKVSYGVIRKSIRIREITRATPVRAGFRIYGGMGVRIGADDSLAFTTSMGDAVRIIRKKGRPIVFSSRKSGMLSTLIQTEVDRYSATGI